MERSPLEIPAMAPLKVGDVVSMKGIEGPRMVVTDVDYSGTPENAACRCVWFDTALHMQMQDFPPAILRVARD